jgi:pyruvate/2-oxoglutarate dehydrogenase complex dihydrolipoamide acyltransferase (E2) component
MMRALTLSELKRLTPPFANKADEAEAQRYWAEPPAEERKQAMMQVLRAFYLERGIDIDQPMVKTIRFGTFEEKNREHEEWHRDFERFHASR